MTHPTPAGGSREWRPAIYGGLDLLYAGAFVLLFSQVAPVFDDGVRIVLYSLVAILGAAGVGMFVRRPLGWWLSAVCCGLVLAYAVYLLVQTLLSAAFLAGVYGAFGRGASSLALLAAALIAAFLGVFPSLQLKFLMTRAGRLSFARAPARAS